MPLTDTACKNAKPALKPYKKADAHGLFLHVMPTGAKYWRLKYRYLGKEKLLAIGVYLFSYFLPLLRYTRFAAVY